MKEQKNKLLTNIAIKITDHRTIIRNHVKHIHHHQCRITHHQLEHHHPKTIQLIAIECNNRVQQCWFDRNSHHIRPDNFRFPYAVTPRSSNKKSFFHQSTNEQTPTSTVMETIWFLDTDPKILNNPHSSNYNPLLSYRNWAEMSYESKNYNFAMAPLHNLKDRISE